MRNTHPTLGMLHENRETPNRARSHGARRNPDWQSQIVRHHSVPFVNKTDLVNIFTVFHIESFASHIVD